MIVEEPWNTERVVEQISDIWEPLSEQQRDFLSQHINIRIYSKNEMLYEEGNEPLYLMCLLSGKVKVFMSGVGNRQQIIRTIKEQGFFGYRAAFVRERYQTSASAIETSTVCLIPVNIIIELIKSNISLAIYFIKQLATMLGEADTLTINLTQKHLRGRLAESLISLKDKYGVEEDGSTLSVYLSREDMACLSNMTTSNAIRTLSAFATENLIAIDGRKIKIIDDSKLRKISTIG